MKLLDEVKNMTTQEVYDIGVGHLRSLKGPVTWGFRHLLFVSNSISLADEEHHNLLHDLQIVHDLAFNWMLFGGLKPTAHDTIYTIAITHKLKHTSRDGATITDFGAFNKRQPN